MVARIVWDRLVKRERLAFSACMRCSERHGLLLDGSSRMVDEEWGTEGNVKLIGWTTGVLMGGWSEREVAG